MPNHLLRFLQLTDSTLPIGGYAHSSGLETYVQQGLVKDVATARAFVTAMLQQNIQYNDAAFVSLAFDAAVEEDAARLLELNEQCGAVKLPAESREASRKLGTRLMKIFYPLCHSVIARRFKEAITKDNSAGHYPVVFAIFSVAMQLSKYEALTGFCYNAAASMVTNAVKLIPLGQLSGQEILFSLEPVIQDVVNNALHPDVNMLGVCCPAFDIRCMQHEQLYSRLYMS